MDARCMSEDARYWRACMHILCRPACALSCLLPAACCLLRVLLLIARRSNSAHGWSRHIPEPSVVLAVVSGRCRSVCREKGFAGSCKVQGKCCY